MGAEAAFMGTALSFKSRWDGEASWRCMEWRFQGMRLPTTEDPMFAAMDD